jgi:hypothetical protein
MSPGGGAHHFIRCSKLNSSTRRPRLVRKCARLSVEQFVLSDLAVTVARAHGGAATRLLFFGICLFPLLALNRGLDRNAQNPAGASRQ